jgi:hypothetical protein
MIGDSNACSTQRFLHPKNGSPEEWLAEQGKFNDVARLRICWVNGFWSTSDRLVLQNCAGVEDRATVA